MAELNIEINGRPYRLACNDGEEDHLRELAGFLDQQVREIEGAFGKIGDSRTLVMAGLSIADRLSEALTRIEKLQEDLAAAQDSTRGAKEQSRKEEQALAVKIDQAAERLERLAGLLAEGA
ncbi:MAG: cell division protein ZapA [Hyphomicrobiales bacterium]|nr:MAG: cell division protein ZapA [Hyphomicrobiales bacterium]